MSESITTARRAAQWLVAFMSAGPFAIGLDLAFHIFPATPVIEQMRGGEASVHVAWVACGFIGIAAIIFLGRRPLLGFLLSTVLAVLYVISGAALWHHLTFYTLIASAVPFIAGYAAFGARRRPTRDG
ncbi:hypothetical protein [Dyella subtropica]|uniref:hypothetical protein n=1 Tax=Dyella subtropica TaxID=2992127 RepID=UPI00224D4C75|nr:hypothetical protein [Dyella subtropica]